MNETFEPRGSSEGKEGIKEAIESAQDILGKENVYGPDAVKAALGFEISADSLPEIPFDSEALEEAAENGEQLMLRTDKFADGTPITMQALWANQEMQGKKSLAVPAEEIQGGAIKYDMEFFTKEELKAQWVLVKVETIPGTNHLSYDAQKAFMEGDFDQLEGDLNDIPKQWVAAGIGQEAHPDLPTIEQLKSTRESMGENVQLPKSIELVYDLLLRQSRGEYPLKDVSVATRSRNQELPAIDEPERPIDVGLGNDDGIHFHWRRNMQFGRPWQTGPDSVPGIPIGYTQRTK